MMADRLDIMNGTCTIQMLDFVPGDGDDWCVCMWWTMRLIRSSSADILCSQTFDIARNTH